MTFYCTGKTCLRARLLRYFGEEAPEGCGSCSVCLGRDDREKETGPAWEEGRGSSRTAAGQQEPAWEGNPALMARLRQTRAALAAEKKVPAFVIFSDAALRSMAELCPTDEKQFLQVKGVGTAKASQYAGPFTSCIQSYLTETGGDSRPRLSSRSTVGAAAPPAGTAARQKSTETVCPKPKAAERPGTAENTAQLLHKLKMETENDWPLKKMAKTHGLTMAELCRLLVQMDW